MKDTNTVDDLIRQYIDRMTSSKASNSADLYLPSLIDIAQTNIQTISLASLGQILELAVMQQDKTNSLIEYTDTLIKCIEKCTAHQGHIPQSISTAFAALLQRPMYKEWITKEFDDFGWDSYGERISRYTTTTHHQSLALKLLRLIPKLAQTHTPDHDGRTNLDYAINNCLPQTSSKNSEKKAQNQKVLRFLLENGADKYLHTLQTNSLLLSPYSHAARQTDKTALTIITTFRDKQAKEKAAEASEERRRKEKIANKGAMETYKIQRKKRLEQEKIKQLKNSPFYKIQEIFSTTSLKKEVKIEKSITLWETGFINGRVSYARSLPETIALFEKHEALGELAASGHLFNALPLSYSHRNPWESTSTLAHIKKIFLSPQIKPAHIAGLTQTKRLKKHLEYNLISIIRDASLNQLLHFTRTYAPILKSFTSQEEATTLCPLSRNKFIYLALQFGIRDTNNPVDISQFYYKCANGLLSQLTLNPLKSDDDIQCFNLYRNFCFKNKKLRKDLITTHEKISKTYHSAEADFQLARTYKAMGIYHKAATLLETAMEKQPSKTLLHKCQSQLISIREVMPLYASEQTITQGIKKKQLAERIHDSYLNGTRDIATDEHSFIPSLNPTDNTSLYKNLNSKQGKLAFIVSLNTYFRRNINALKQCKSMDGLVYNIRCFLDEDPQNVVFNKLSRNQMFQSGCTLSLTALDKAMGHTQKGQIYAQSSQSDMSTPDGGTAPDLDTKKQQITTQCTS